MSNHMQPDVALIAIQHKLEQEALDRGAERYRKALEKGEDTMPPGMKLIKAATKPMAAALQTLIDDTLAGRPGKHTNVVKFLSQFDPEVAAFVTIKVVLSLCAKPTMQQAVAAAIGRTLEDSLNWDAIRSENPRLYDKLIEQLSIASNAKYKHVVMRNAQNRLKIDVIDWGISERVRMGSTLLHFAITTTGLFEERVMGSGKDSKIIICATEETLKWLEDAHTRCELMSPATLPMVVKPRAWTTPTNGGFLRPELALTMIKTSNEAYLEEVSNWDMPLVYRAVNALQDTGWCVNTGVLTVAAELWERGGRCAGMPSRENLPLPPKDFPADATSDDDRVKDWKRRAAEVYQANIYTLSKRVAVSEKLAIAARFAEFDQFFYPYTLDWRGRAYPVASHLSPQGDDLSKALLRFAEGMPLGESGAYWLAVHGANCFGIDKVPFDERVQWVQDNHDMILECALSPLEGSRKWMNAGSPFQFLAFCKEWLGFTMQGEAFVSHIPVSWDGSCNGLQNYSAMLRDPIGGAATGLVPSHKPSDIYTEVKNVSARMIEDLAKQDHEVAKRWVGKMERRLTKRNTMTVPYSVSVMGMRDQQLAEFSKMVEERREKLARVVGTAEEAAAKAALEDAQSWGWEDAMFLAKTNYEAIGNVVVAARQAMDWLKEASRVAARGALPIHWETPSGFPVLQHYRKSVGKRLDFTVAGKRYQMMLQKEGEQLDTRKQAAGIAPNFIHSLDAAHLMRTINYCMDAGMTSFAMVHDSYGARAGESETLAQLLRQAFVDQYEGDVLARFRDHLIEQLPPELADELPPLPKMGALDLQGVLKSDYFFA